MAQGDDPENAQNRQKLNIFDANDSTQLKHETLARIQMDEVAIPNSDSVSNFSQTSTNSVRLKPIEYLNKTKQ
jgi:hypothetical protein